MNDDKESIIAALVQEYTSLISRDHHKNCDGFFFLGELKRFNGYSGKIDSVFSAEHRGYCNEWSDIFDTYDEAADYMIERLREAIEREKAAPIDVE